MELRKHLSQLSLFGCSIILLCIEKLSAMFIQPESFSFTGKLNYLRDDFLFHTTVLDALHFHDIVENEKLHESLEIRDFNAEKIGFENVQIESILTFKIDYRAREMKLIL